MEIRLGKNIRAFRKQRSLTQEQLAEVLGVSTGAVYKWEADLSIPELGMILEMADFFDTSVDVLLGYEMRDNRLETSLLLFDQNTDPMGDKIIVYQNMATVYEELGEIDKAIGILRTHNPFGIFNHQLGLILSVKCRDHKTALPCLSHSLR